MPGAVVCYLINIGIRIPGNNVVCNGNGFVNGYYEYPTPTPAPAPATAIEFNETGNKLEYVFGAYLCENNIFNEINNNEMNNNGILYF